MNKTNTSTVRADSLTRGAVLVVGFCGGRERVESVSYTSAGAYVRVGLCDGATRYHRPHALIEVA